MRLCGLRPGLRGQWAQPLCHTCLCRGQAEEETDPRPCLLKPLWPQGLHLPLPCASSARKSKSDTSTKDRATPPQHSQAWVTTPRGHSHAPSRDSLGLPPLPHPCALSADLWPPLH